MELFNEFLNKIENDLHREIFKEVLSWILTKFPVLEPSIRWNQPMFTHHGTYIIGFSMAKNHFAVGPERKAIIKFSNEIKEAGLSQTKHLFKIEWSRTVPYDLLERIIKYNIEDKHDYVTFWREEAK